MAKKKKPSKEVQDYCEESAWFAKQAKVYEITGQPKEYVDHFTRAARTYANLARLTDILDVEKT